jgi:hypothetical protein
MFRERRSYHDAGLVGSTAVCACHLVASRREALCGSLVEGNNHGLRAVARSGCADVASDRPFVSDRGLSYS